MYVALWTWPRRGKTLRMKWGLSSSLLLTNHLLPNTKVSHRHQPCPTHTLKLTPSTCSPTIGAGLSEVALRVASGRRAMSTLIFNCFSHASVTRCLCDEAATAVAAQRVRCFIGPIALGHTASC